MNKDSLEKAKKLIIDVLDKSDINTSDKLELILNIYCLLDEEKYDNNILILKKELLHDRTHLQK